MGRLFITGRTSGETYDKLRLEWQDKIQNAGRALANAEQDTAKCIDELDAALLLISSMPMLYDRLDEKQRSQLLPVLIKRLIVDIHGEIVNYELISPFTNLRQLVKSNGSSEMISKCSTWSSLGASEKRAPSERRSSPVNSVSSPSKEFESPLVVTPITDVTAFLAGLRFEHRDMLADFPVDLVKPISESTAKK